MLPEPERRDDDDRRERRDGDPRGPGRDYYLAPLVDAEITTQDTLAGVGGDPGVLGVVRRYAGIMVTEIIRSEKNERNFQAGFGRIQDWLTGMRVVSNGKRESLFSKDVDADVTGEVIEREAIQIGRELNSIEKIADAYAYQLAAGGDVGNYAEMIKGGYGRVVPQAIDYANVVRTNGLNLPATEIGTHNERIVAIASNVVPDYYRKPGATLEEAALEIENNSFGVMIDQAMRCWQDAALGRGLYNDFGPIFTLPKYSILFDDLAKKMARNIGLKFGYRVEAMNDPNSMAFTECRNAAIIGLLIFRQLDLDMQYCSVGPSGDADPSEINVELVHNDAGKMAYFMMRLWGQSANHDYPYDVGIARSVQDTVHNLVQSAMHTGSVKREYIDPATAKKKTDYLSLMQLWDGTNGQKGLRFDQLPWGEPQVENDSVVGHYFDSVKGVRAGEIEIKGIPEDFFNVPYCLGLNYAYKYFGLITGDPYEAIKRLGTPATLGGLNKPMETYLNINFGSEFGEESKTLLSKVVLLDKINLLIAAHIASTEPGVTQIGGGLDVEQLPLVDNKSDISGILGKFANSAAILKYGRNSGFLTVPRAKDKDEHGKFSRSHRDARGVMVEGDTEKTERLQNIEMQMLDQGTRTRRGITLEEAASDKFKLFTEDEVTRLRASHLYSNVSN